MSGEIDLIPGWTWQAGQALTAAALDATGTGLTATVRAHSIGTRELNPLAVAELVKSVVGGYRATVKTTTATTLASGTSASLGPFTVTGIVGTMVVVPVGLVLGLLVGGKVQSADTLYLTVRNPNAGTRAIPAGTPFSVAII